MPKNMVIFSDVVIAAASLKDKQIKKNMTVIIHL